MCIGENPAAAVHNLRDYIVHTHAKDGIMLKKTDTRKLYIPDISHVDPENFSDYILETPLGQGNVPWKEYISALRSVGYDGYLTIEREVGDTPSEDIALAAEFLKQLI